MAGFAALTTSVALPVLPEPAMAADTVPVTLVYVPALAAVTGTVIAQLPAATIDPPERLSPLPPGVAETAPPQLLVT